MRRRRQRRQGCRLAVATDHAQHGWTNMWTNEWKRGAASRKRTLCAAACPTSTPTHRCGPTTDAQHWSGWPAQCCRTVIGCPNLPLHTALQSKQSSCTCMHLPHMPLPSYPAFLGPSREAKALTLKPFLGALQKAGSPQTIRDQHGLAHELATTTSAWPCVSNMAPF